MAAELIGTAYVRIKAITTGLAKDISDGVDKGVKDAGPDIDKSGEGIGEGLSKGAGKKFKGEFPGDVTEALGDKEIDKSSEDAGGRISQNIRKGHEDENKKRNPFSSLLDSLRKIGKDTRSELPSFLDSPELDSKSEETGSRISRGIRKGHDKENDKRNPFMSLLDKMDGALKPLQGIVKKGLLAALSPDIISGAAAALAAGLAGAVAAVGALLEAGLGAGVALGGVFSAAIPGAAVLMAALKADTKELQAFKKAAADLLKPWKEVAVATQKTLLPGLLDALDVIQDLVPLFAEFGGVIGGIGADFARMAGQILVSDRSISDLSVILEASTGFFENMRDTGLNLFQTITPLMAALAPIAVQLSESLEKMAIKFREFILAKSDSGELTTTFQGWYDKLVVLAGIVADLGVGLFNIFTIGAEWGGDMFKSLSDVTSKFREWTSSAEGKTKIEEFFDRVRPLAHEIWGLLTDIAKIVVAPVIDASGTEGATEFVKSIREDWLPTFRDLATALAGKGIGDALKNLADSLIGLIEAAGGTGTLSSTIGTLALAIDGLATILSNPIVQAIAPVLVTIAGGIAALSFILTPVKVIVSALGSLGTALTGLAGFVGFESFGAMMGALGTALLPVLPVILAVVAAVAAFIAVWHFWPEISGFIAEAWDWFTKLSTPLKILIGVLGGFIILTNPILLGAAAIIALVAAFKNFDKVKEWVMGAWEGIKDFFTNLPQMLSELPGRIMEFIGNIGTWFQELPAKIGEGLSGLGSALKEGLLNGLRELPTLILDALGGLADIGGKIVGFLARGIQEHIGDVVQFFVELPFKILEVLGTIASVMFDVGISILKFLIEGLVNYGPKVLTFFLKLPFEIMTLLRKGLTELVKLGFEMVVALVEGIVKAAPRVLKWFQDLPGNILEFLINAAQWLLAVGGQIIDGLWQGIQTNWDKVISFFTGLPAKLGAFFVSAASWLLDAGGKLISGLWQGAQEVWASFNEFLMGLPTLAVEAVGDFFTTIWNGILSGSEAFLSNVGTWVTNVVQFFIDLPGKALEAIGDLGMTIWNAVTGGFSTALTNVGNWVTDVWNKLVEFASGVPGKVAEIVTSLPGKIAEATAAALEKITTWVTDGLAEVGKFVTGIPGALLDLASKVGDEIKNGLDAGIDKIKTWVTDALNEVGKFVTGLPGKMTSLAGDLSSAVLGALKKAWNSAVDSLSFTWEIPIPPHPKISFSGSFLKFAQGGIIPGSALGWPVIVGEGGREEAIVPMTRPARALAVMQQAGLDKLVLRSYLGGAVTQTTNTGDVTMLRIDKASINAPVDADMIVQKIGLAYRRAS
jgi:hypothetical protein